MHCLDIKRMPNHDATTDEHTQPIAQILGAILWPSFFAAGVMTMVFFALIDPLELRDISFPNWQISRGFGYSICFFMFWLATASSSLFSWILLRPAQRLNRSANRNKV